MAEGAPTAYRSLSILNNYQQNELDKVQPLHQHPAPSLQHCFAGSQTKFARIPRQPHLALLRPAAGAAKAALLIRGAAHDNTFCSPELPQPLKDSRYSLTAMRQDTLTKS